VDEEDPPRSVPAVDPCLRIALVVNPFTLRRKGGRHAPELARELLGRGHVVNTFGDPAGTIPHSGKGTSGETGAAGIVGFGPDLVLAYDSLSPAAFAGARASRRAGVPLVLIEPGPASEERSIPRLLRRTGERVFGPIVRATAARVVALDPVARDQALAEGFAPGRVVEIPTGVDLTRYRPGLMSSLITRHRIGGRILLYAGRISAQRGLETLVEAFARTVGQRSDWALVLAGEGSEQGRLRAHADRLGVGSSTVFLGRVRSEELPGLMGASTALAVPAVDQGVRGRMIPRALACGLPVLASDLPRLRYLLGEDERCGILLSPGNSAAWALGISRLAGSPEVRKRWIHKAREVAEERFGWPRVAGRFEALFRETLLERDLQRPASR
jgi:glycosyltransferase involved in cell wall biosynthesis